MAFHAPFDLDLALALKDQLVVAFSGLSLGAFDAATIGQVSTEQGVYQLHHKGTLVYVGKADKLRNRLMQHHTKIGGRQNISATDMGFKCLYVNKNWTTLAPEDALIKFYKDRAAGDCEWNGNGFGPNDPGRERETTNKDPDGFDAQYPIRHDWPCTWATAGDWNALDLLIRLKEELPFLLRYQTDKSGGAGHWKKGHPDQAAAKVTLPRAGMPAAEILSLIAKAMPGWQATRFPSHMVLYKESQAYRFGVTL